MGTSSNSAGLDTIPANRQIKDGVFRLLFDDPEKAAELYYALSGEEFGIHSKVARVQQNL